MLPKWSGRSEVAGLWFIVIRDGTWDSWHIWRYRQMSWPIFFLLLLNLLRCYCICTAVSSLSVFIVLDSFIYLVTLCLFCLRGMISGISELSLSLSVSGFWFISHCILLLFCVFCVTFNCTLYLCILCWMLVFVITLIQYWWVWTANKKRILFVYCFTISGNTTEAQCRMASIFVAKKTFLAINLLLSFSKFWRMLRFIRVSLFSLSFFLLPFSWVMFVRASFCENIFFQLLKCVLNSGVFMLLWTLMQLSLCMFPCF